VIKDKKIIAGLMVAAFLLMYPLAWMQVIEPVNGFQFLPLFPPFVMVMMAGAACLYNGRKLFDNLNNARYVLITTAAFFIVGLCQLFTHSFYNADQYLSSLTWCVFSLFFYLYAAESIAIMPMVMALIWCGTVMVSIRELFMPRQILFGVPGNYNWNATLLAVSAIFLLHYLYGRLSALSIWRRLVVLVFPAGLTLLLIYWCGSKGTWAGLAAGLLLYVIAVLRRYRRVLIGVAIAVGIGGYACLLFYPSLVEKVIRDDVRVSLWQGCSALIRDHWLTGTSPAGFESAYAEYIPEEYYLNKHAAARHNHPHNEFLYVLASCGIPVGLIWAGMVIFPLLSLVFNPVMRRRETLWLPVLLSAVLLTVHGSLDLVIFEWPTSFLFVWLLGVMWYWVWPTVELPEKRVGVVWRVMVPAMSLLMLALAAGMTVYNVYASYFSWSGIQHYSMKNYSQADASWGRYLAMKSDPYILYRAGNNAFIRLRDSGKALGYYLRLSEIGCTNYANNNGFIGQIYLLQGKPAEALPYLRQETMNFPLGVSGWYFLAMTQSLLGLKEDEAISKQEMLRSLRLKGLDLSHLELLLRDPYYDLNWRQVREKMLSEEDKRR